MKAVTDYKRSSPILGLHENGRRMDGVASRYASLLRDDVFRIDPALDQILRAYVRFGEILIWTIAAGCDDGICVAHVVKVQGVVKSGLQDGRWMAIILGGAEHNDCVGIAGFV